MRFDMICEANGIEHRLTKPNHPWTNGQVERMNRTIKDATVKRFHYETHDQLRTHLADFLAAYNSRDRVIDPILEAKGQVVMPAKSNSIDQRDYDRHLYKARHLIENFFAKLKQYRAIAIRYDKLTQNFLSAIYLASTIIWIN